MLQEPQEQKHAITKAISIKGSTLTVIPKAFLKGLGIGADSYLEHVLTPEGMLTRVVRLPSNKPTPENAT